MEPDATKLIGGPREALPHVEVVTRPAGPERTSRLAWYRARRMVVFLSALALFLVAGLAWDFLRPALYRATASVVTVDPILTARKSQPKEPGAPPPGPDEQNMAIQDIVLLGPDLLEDTLHRARKETELDVTSVDRLRPMLRVSAVPDTNIVKLSAVGDAPEELAAIVNSWLAAYLDLRQRQVQREFGDRLATLQQEHENLGKTIERKRDAVDRFREEHDIVTLERDGNEALARLNALTDNLNKARDDVVKYKAQLAAVRAAIARGDPIVPDQEQPGLEALQQKVADLRAKLAELRTRYTEFFLENEPEKRQIPGQIRELEALTKDKITQGQRVLVSQTQQKIAEAHQRVEVLRGELAKQKEVAAHFTNSFAEYKGLESELDRFQKMYSQAESQVVDMEVRASGKYPPVDVIEKAYPPGTPFYPHYWRDALLILVGAALLALIAVWVLEYLTRRPRDDEELIPVTGVRVYSGGRALAIPESSFAGLTGGQQVPAITEAQAPTLPTLLPREPLPAEVAALWDLAEPPQRELMALLLCGVGPEECALLSAEDFLLDDSSLRVPGKAPRKIDLPPAARKLFSEHAPVPLWADAESPAASVAELAGRIPLLASDAGVAQPQEMTADALRHGYLAFLVRQGARLTELERIVGSVPDNHLKAYAALSPAGPGKRLDAVERVYPALR
jgi:uncharacterized protein involved in exopolysaccharide biosynthesis